MIVEKVQQPIAGWKPKMKNLRFLNELPLSDTVVSVKADGEFVILHYALDVAYTLNPYGTRRRSFPALDEAREILQTLGHTNTVLKCEQYAVDEYLMPLPAWTYNHILKGQGTDHRQLRLGFFDIVALEGKAPEMSYSDKMDLLDTWFSNAKYCHALKYIIPNSHEEVFRFWDEWVEEQGFEGLVANVGSTKYAPGQFYKMKPEEDIDAVVLGINKKPTFKDKLVTSLKIGVLDEDGDYIVIGDVSSGMDNEMKSFLWRLLEYEVEEPKDENGQSLYNDKVIWIKPFLVVAVKFQQPIEAAKVKLSYADEQYALTANKMYYSLRHPRLDRFRSDKKATREDVPASQL